MRNDRWARLTQRPTALARADAARDEGRWSQARDLYRDVLDIEPERADIWVQYGHALKESGGLSEAKAAYERALSIDDQVSDTHLQLGHALKLLGDVDGALQSYAKANALDPRSAAVVGELRALDADPATFAAPLRGEGADCVAIDLSDVFFYLRHHDTLSGIQRVQMGIANALIALGETLDRQFIFVVDGGRSGTYVELRAQAIGRLTSELGNAEVSHERLLKIMGEEEGQGSVFTVQAGDVVVVLGAFWVIENAVERFVRVKQAGGRLVVLIHDLIPIFHPEYCEASLTDVFQMFCAHVLQIADLVLTVSEHSGRNVKSFLAANGLAAPPIRTLRPAHLTWDPVDTSDEPTSPRISRIIGKPFVLYVSTIEIRKNHVLLFRIWKELLLRHGSKAVPKLVFVGRPGWRVKDLMDQFESTRLLEGHIQIVHGLSDFELATLYRHALFSAFPSFEEGWGLPVGESLFFGTPCIASNTSSVPEVGEEFALYHDPNNLREALDLYEKAIFDAPFRKSSAAHIRRAFKARTWPDMAADLIASIEEFVPRGGSTAFSAPLVKLAAGRLFQMGHHGDQNDYMRHGLGRQVHFLFDDGWGAVEEHVRWQLRRSASIRFQTEYEGPRDILIVLVVDSPLWLADTTLTISVNGEPFEPITRKRGASAKVSLRHHLTEPTVTLRFEIEGAIARGSDPRPLSYGLSALGYAAIDDTTSRLELAESIVFSAVGVRTLPSSELT